MIAAQVGSCEQRDLQSSPPANRESDQARKWAGGMESSELTARRQTSVRARGAQTVRAAPLVEIPKQDAGHRRQIPESGQEGANLIHS